MDILKQLNEQFSADELELKADLQVVTELEEAQLAIQEIIDNGSFVGLTLNDMMELSRLGLDVETANATLSASFSNYHGVCESVSHNQKMGMIAAAVAALLALLAWAGKKLWSYFKNKKTRKASDAADVKATTITIATYKELESKAKFEDMLEKITSIFYHMKDVLDASTIESAISKSSKDGALKEINKLFTTVFTDMQKDMSVEVKVDLDGKTFAQATTLFLDAAKDYQLPLDGKVDIDLDMVYDLPKGLESEMDDFTKDLDKLSKANLGTIKLAWEKVAGASTESFVAKEIVSPAARFSSFCIRKAFIPFLQEAARMNAFLDKSDINVAKFAAPDIVASNAASKNTTIAGIFAKAQPESLNSILDAYKAVTDKDVGDLFPGSHGAYVSFMGDIAKANERYENQKKINK